MAVVIPKEQMNIYKHGWWRPQGGRVRAAVEAIELQLDPGV
jgi:hypothetical protein